MRRLIARITLLVVLLTLVAVSGVLAAPAAQDRFGTLESLNVYFPKDTMLYAATRTDANFVAWLDQLAQTIESQLPSGTIPPAFPKTLSATLDLLTQQAAGQSFNSSIRPWLGDTLAVGIYPAVRSAGGRIVIKITDAKAATQAILKTLTGWSSRQADGYTLLSDSTSTNRAAVYSDVLIFYSWSDDVGPQKVAAVTPNVSTNTYYTTALSRLPGIGYDMIAFVDTPLMLAYNQRQGYQDSAWVFQAAIYRMMGATAFGAHLESNQSLTVDVAQTLGNTTGLDALGVQFTGQGAALTPEILQHVPNDAFFVMQAADVGSMLEFVGTSGQNAAKKFQVLLSSIITGVAYNYSASTAGLVSGGFTSFINPDWAKVFFSNLSGYDYTTEIRPLLNNSALFLNFNPSYNPSSSTFVNREPLDGAIIFEATDAETAQKFVSKLQRELAITMYTSADDNKFRIQDATLPGGAVGMSVSVYGETGQPFDQFIAAAQDKWLVIGTTRAVNRVLSSDGLGFSGASGVTLPDAGAAIYANFPAPQSPEWTTFSQSDPGNMTMRLLPNFVQNVTFSVAGSEQNDLLMRLNITAPCGDNCG